MGKNHVLTGLAVAGSSCAVLVALAHSPHEPVAHAAQFAARFALGTGGMDTVLTVVLSAVLVVFGSLLPDIDSPHSILGRHLCFPGPHHGITHTDWVSVLLLGAAWIPGCSVLIWLWLGVAVHLRMDGFSRAGRVRFYPLSPYRTITLGSTRCVVVPGSRRGLYRVGQPSETVVLLAVLGLCAVVTTVALSSLGR